MKIQNMCLILLAVIGLAACSPPDPVSPTALPSDTTALPVVTATVTRTLRPTPLPTYTLTSTLLPTLTPTVVPEGTFALKFYPPTVLNYDPQTWVDRSEYDNVDRMINFLQARNLGSCTVSVMGPSGFGPPTDNQVVLGKNEFSVATLDETDSTIADRLSAAYFQYGVLEDYTIVLMVTASRAEWVACQSMAEEVLESLHLASG